MDKQSQEEIINLSKNAAEMLLSALKGQFEALIELSAFLDPIKDSSKITAIDAKLTQVSKLINNINDLSDYNEIFE